MGGIKSFTGSNPVPVDLAEKLGADGIRIILNTMWMAYYDLYSDGNDYSTADEDSITVEWYTKLFDRWTSENRASQVRVKLIPISQFPDETHKKPFGKPPTIDFCFRSWNKNEGYFGAECKRLNKSNNKLTKEQVVNGVMRYVDGRYASQTCVSAMIGYLQGGRISDIVTDLRQALLTSSLEENLTRELYVPDPEYTTVHKRSITTQRFLLYHLFFDFTSKH